MNCLNLKNEILNNYDESLSLSKEIEINGNETKQP